MDKTKILIELKQSCISHVVSHGFKVREDFDLHACDLLISNPCVGVFFAVSEESSSLLTIWRTAQSEITKLKDTTDTSNFKKLPRDLVLTLITPDEGLDRGLINEIVTDAYTCRKFILPVNGEPLEKSLEILPFWPSPELEEDADQEFGQGVDRLLLKTGFDAQLIEDLARKGVDKIVARIGEGKYSLRIGSSIEAKKSYDTGPVHKSKKSKLDISARTARVTRLDLSDFRGLRNLGGGLNLGADVIFIYGPNGTGKTSIFDSIEWAVTGTVTRLHSDPDRNIEWSDSLINLFSESQETTVTLELSTGRRITRTKQLNADTFSAVDNTKARESQITKTIICRERLPELDQRLVPDLIRRSHFLGQHNIREFISGGDSDRDPATERFKVLSKLFGRDDFVKRSDKLKRLIKELDIATLALREEMKNERELLFLLKNQIQGRKAVIVERAKIFKDKSPINTEANYLAQQLDLVQIHLATPLPEEGESYHTIASYLIDLESALKDRKENLQKRIEQMLGLSRKAEQRQSRQESIKKIGLSIDTIQMEIDAKEQELASIENKLKTLKGELFNSQEHENELLLELKKTELLLANAPALMRVRKDVGDNHKELDLLNKKRTVKIEERTEITVKASEIEEELFNYQAELERRKTIRNRLITLASAFDELDDLIKQVHTADKQRMELSNQLEENRRLLSEKTNKATALKSELSDVDKSLTINSQQRQRKSDLIAELEQYVDSNKCPFCGHEHESQASLQQHVAQQISLVPEAIVHFTSRKEFLSKELTLINQEIAHYQTTVSNLTAERDNVNRDLEVINQKVEHWRLEALNLGVINIDSDLNEFVRKRELQVDDSEYIAILNKVLEIEEKSHEYKRQMIKIEEVIKQLDIEIENHQELLEGLSSEVEYFTLQLSDHNITFDDYDEQKTNAKWDVVIKAIESIKQEMAITSKKIAEIEKNYKELYAVLATLKSDFRNMNNQREVLFKDEDEYISHLAAEQLPDDADIGMIQKRLQELRLQLDVCADLQQRRDRIYEAVSVEQLKRDLAADEEKLLKGQEGLAPFEDKIKFYELWKEELNECLKSIGVEQNTRVKEQLKSFEPTINKICQRLSPHPLFEEIKLEVISKRGGKDGALQIYAGLDSGQKEVGTKSSQGIPPSSFFSEAQMNILALSIFLTCAIRQSWSGFRLIAIDDPVQQMDDLNANAFFDLICTNQDLI